MELIGRIVLVLLMVASPWVFGGVTPEAICVVCMTMGGLLAWRLVESVFVAPDRPIHVPVTIVAPVGLMLIATTQLLPRDDAPASRMHHAVFAEYANGIAAEGLKTGTISTMTTRTQSAKLFFGMAAFVLASVWFSTPRSQSWLWGFLTINGAVLGFFGIVQRLTWNGMLFWQVPLRFGGTPFASYVNRNNAAGYLNLCLAAGIGWLFLQLSPRLSEGRGNAGVVWKDSAKRLGSTRQTHRLPWKVRVLSRIASINGTEVGILGLIVAIAAAVMFSLSRGGILAGLLAPLLTWIIFSRVAHSRGGGVSIWALLGTIGLAGSATIGLLMWLQGWELISERLASLGDPFAASEGRLLHWWETSAAVLDFPVFGTGLGTYRYANLPYQSRASHAWYVNADNHYFELLVETGILGLLLFVGGFYLTGLASVSLMRNADPSFRAAGIVGMSALLSQAIQSVTDFGLLIPANGLAFALISGAVCGLACHAADFRQFRVSAWLSLVRLDGRIGVISLSLILAITGGLFGVEILGATRSSLARNTVIRIVPHRPLKTRMVVLEDAIENGVNVLQSRPDDAELHQAVAEWWIDRYRLQAFQEIREPLGEISGRQAQQLWYSTSVPVLQARVAQVWTEGHEDQLQAIRRIPAIRANLGHAYRHLLEASSLNPLMRGNATTLASLAILQNPNERDPAPSEEIDRLIERALFVGPSIPDELLKTGLLADSLGYVSLSQIALGRYLEMSEDHLALVWATLRGQAAVDELLKDVIPNRLEVLVSLAEATTDVVEKQQLVSRSEELVNGVKPDDYEEFPFILIARLAELQGNTKEAIAAYREVILRSPEEIEPRLKLARLLKSDGQLEQAENEYRVLKMLAPKRRDVKEELDDVRIRRNL